MKREEAFECRGKSGGGDVCFAREKTRTSMTLGWCSSRRYLTSRTADMSRPSLNWPTLIFLMAILRPVASSRPEEEGGRVGERGHLLWMFTRKEETSKTNRDRRLHTFPLPLFGPSPFLFT